MDRNITITALSQGTRRELSNLLNPERLFMSESKKLRDWRGLSVLCGIESHLESFLKTNKDQTNFILNTWLEKDSNQSTISKLLEFLEDLDRYDIIDDITPLIDKDIEAHKKRQNEAQIVSSRGFDVITRDDLALANSGEGKLMDYDAFMIFSPEDIEFARQILHKMEERGLFFCVVERDLLAWTFIHAAVMKLIERSRKIVVILSEAFVKDDLKDFYYKFAEFLSLRLNDNKITPITKEKLDNLPSDYDLRTKIHFNSLFYDAYDRLHEHISGKITPRVRYSEIGPYNNNIITRSTTNEESINTLTVNGTKLSKKKRKLFSFKKMFPPKNTELPAEVGCKSSSNVSTGSSSGSNITESTAEASSTSSRERVAENEHKVITDMASSTSNCEPDPQNEDKVLRDNSIPENEKKVSTAEASSEPISESNNKLGKKWMKSKKFKICKWYNKKQNFAAPVAV